MNVWGSKPKYTLNGAEVEIEDYSLFSTIIMMHLDGDLPEPFRVMDVDGVEKCLYVGDICVADMGCLYVAFRKWLTEEQKENIERTIRDAYKACMLEKSAALDVALMKAVIKDGQEQVR